MDEIVALHRDQIERYGGAEGVRDLGLLESATAMPEAFFGDEYLHGTLPETAVANLSHLTQNHPFVDENKRVATAAMFKFRYLNDLELPCDENELVELTPGVTRGKTMKTEIAMFIVHHARPTR